MRQQVWVVILLLVIGCAQIIRPRMPIPKDPSLEELLFLYQREREAIPHLKGLMKVTIRDKIDKGFWAKWRSRKGAIEIDGYNLFGETLFNVKLNESEISFVSSENNFKGSREGFQQYLMGQPSEVGIRMEWITLLDQIARGGLPDPSLPDRPVLEKENNQLVLGFLNSNDHLTQKMLIDSASRRITEGIFFDSDGFPYARIIFYDYRLIRQTLFPFSIKIEARGKQEARPRDMEIVFKELKALAE